MKKPALGEYAPFYETYVKLIDNPFEVLEAQHDAYLQYIEDNKNRLDYAYAEGKWTIRQCIMHVVDCELIFVNRLIRISRGDQTSMPGFEQNDYIENTDFSHLGAADLKNTFSAVRKSTLAVVKALSEKQYDLIGYANEAPVSVRAILFILPGHTMHHMNIFNERYV